MSDLKELCEAVVGLVGGLLMVIWCIGFPILVVIAIFKVVFGD